MFRNLTHNVYEYVTQCLGFKHVQKRGAKTCLIPNYRFAVFGHGLLRKRFQTNPEIRQSVVTVRIAIRVASQNNLSKTNTKCDNLMGQGKGQDWNQGCFANVSKQIQKYESVGQGQDWYYYCFAK